MRTYGSPSDLGGYKWVAGNSDVPYYDFYTRVGEPNGKSGELCVEMRGKYGYKWNNRHCDARLPVVCKVRIPE